MLLVFFKAYWKFCLVLLICDAITKLLCQRTTDNQTKWLPDHVIYSALEVDLYWNFFLAVIGKKSLSICFTWSHFSSKGQT